MKDFETGKRTPMRNNLEAIRTAFEAAGIGFTFAAGGKPAGITHGDTGQAAGQNGNSA